MQRCEPPQTGNVMGHHDPLTEADMQGHSPNYRMLTHLEAFRLRTCRQESSGLNILDYGCGRGADALWLRQQGFNAFGVDIDPESIGNGRPLCASRGLPEACLGLLSSAGRAPHPDGFFHFTFSNQAFEHVEDLQRTAAELYRLTAPGGAGYHRYTANRTLVEEHLHMPLIHWLPKNALRKALIALYVRLGVQPGWLPDRSIEEQVERYYAYSVHSTFYRPWREVRRIFEQAGFLVGFGTKSHPKLLAHPLTRLPMAFGPTASLAASLIQTFLTVELLLTKPGGTGLK